MHLFCDLKQLLPKNKSFFKRGWKHLQATAYFGAHSFYDLVLVAEKAAQTKHYMCHTETITNKK